MGDLNQVLYKMEIHGQYAKRINFRRDICKLALLWPEDYKFLHIYICMYFRE